MTWKHDVRRGGGGPAASGNRAEIAAAGEVAGTGDGRGRMGPFRPYLTGEDSGVAS